MLEMALSTSMLVAHRCQRMDKFLKVRMSKLGHLILRYHQLVVLVRLLVMKLNLILGMEFRQESNPNTNNWSWSFAS